MNEAQRSMEFLAEQRQELTHVEITDKGYAALYQKKAYELTRVLEEVAAQLVQPYRSASECIQTRRRLAEAVRNVVEQYGEHEEPRV